MKKCTKCKEEKALDQFSRDKTSGDGLGYRCKKCKAKDTSERRKRDPEKYKEAQRKHLENNYEKVRASQRRHRLENREKINARRREKRKPRAAELNALEKERRKNDPNFLVGNRIRYKKYWEKNREALKPKRNAHQLVMYAVKLGMLLKPENCEKCMKKCAPHGHHTDYSKPLEVIWLCHSCHKLEHLKYAQPPS